MSESNSKPLKYCRVCQCDTERSKDGRCKPCLKAYLYEWRKNNPQKLRAIQKKWDAKNEDRLKQAAKALYQRSRNKKIEYAKQYYEENKEALKPKRAKWQRENMAKIVVYCSKRRARKKGAGGSLSSDIRNKLFVLQRGMCACCGNPLGEKFHLDHIMPLALGGSDSDDNVQLLRQKCNSRKAAKHPVDYMQSLGFLL